MGQFLPAGIFSGGRFKASFTAPSEPSSAIVSGAGTAAANGTYTLTGTQDGKPFYNKVGTDPYISSVVWDVRGDPVWSIKSSIGEDMYSSDNDVAFPWLAVWAVGAGDSPAPTVTES